MKSTQAMTHTKPVAKRSKSAFSGMCRAGRAACARNNTAHERSSASGNLLQRIVSRGHLLRVFFPFQNGNFSSCRPRDGGGLSGGRPDERKVVVDEHRQVEGSDAAPRHDVIPGIPAAAHGRTSTCAATRVNAAFHARYEPFSPPQLRVLSLELRYCVSILHAPSAGRTRPMPINLPQRMSPLSGGYFCLVELHTHRIFATYPISQNFPFAPLLPHLPLQHGRGHTRALCGAVLCTCTHALGVGQTVWKGPRAR